MTSMMTESSDRINRLAPGQWTQKLVWYRLVADNCEVGHFRLVSSSAEMSENPQQIWDVAVPNMAADGGRAPWRLRVVTFLFTLAGTTSLVEVCLLWLVKGTIFVDLNAPIALLTAWGLHRRREGWRQAAVFFVSLYLVASLIIVVVAAHATIKGHVVRGFFHIMDRSVEPIFAAIAGVGSALLTYWMLRVLRSPAIRRHFRDSSASRESAPECHLFNHQRGFRFTLESMLLLTLLVAFVMFRITQGELIYDTENHKQATTRNGISQYVEYGIRTNLLFDEPKRLQYVVFSNAVDEWSGISVTTIGGTRATRLTFANGEQVLSGRNQLYEIKNDQLETRRWERVTLEEFESFLSSASDEWTIDALLEHARQMRAKARNGASEKLSR